VTTVEAPPRSRTARPPKPRPGPTRYVAAAVIAAITYWAASETTGIGLVPQLSEVFVDGLSERTGQIVSDIFNPAFEDAPATGGPFLETLSMAVLGTLMGCFLALLVAFGSSLVTAGGLKRYRFTKGLMSLLRSVPDVLWALLFVAAIGTGALSGVLALVLFNIGVVAKLLSETIDAVDTKALEAADAAGAGLVQRARVAVFPQVLPNYLSFSLYAFELNVRASAILGIVGAGGIGVLLNLARNQFRYDRVSLIVVEIFVFVFLTELVSIALRRRLVR